MPGDVFRAPPTCSDEQRRAMQRCLDSAPRARLSDLGVEPGWRCVEVGAGGGSVAT